MLRCAKAGVRTPCVYLVDQHTSRIYMEKVEGHTLKHFLRGRYDPGTGRYGDVAIATVVSTRVCVCCGGLCVCVCQRQGSGGRSTPAPPHVFQHRTHTYTHTTDINAETHNSGSWGGPSQGSTTRRWCMGT